MTYKRKEIIGDCTLYLGDAREITPKIDQKVTVITDPVWPNAPEGMFEIDCLPQDLLSSVLHSISGKIERASIVMRYDSDPRFLCAVPRRLEFFRVSLIPYAVPSPIGRTLSGLETVYNFGTPIKSAKGRHIVPGMCAPIQPKPGYFKNMGHPCPRPINGMEWVVYWYSDQNDIVFDPFMGSGTTAVACISTGRKFIGIEIDETYFDIACARIRDAYKQGDLFNIKTKKSSEFIGELV